MGGSVGVVIKTKNEKISMNRSTNITPWWFSHPDLFLNHFEQWYEGFSHDWLIMKEDYEKNKDTKQFQENMTSFYFPHDTASPCEYGIIFVDVEKKKIYSSQDYASIGQIPLYHFQHDDPDDEEESYFYHLKLLFKAGYIKQIRYYNHEKSAFDLMDISSLSLEELIQFILEANQRYPKEDDYPFSHPFFASYSHETLSPYSTFFIIDSDWEVISYYDRDIGIVKVKQLMMNDGFIFTQADDNEWKEYLSYRWHGRSQEELDKDTKFLAFSQLYQEVFNEPFEVMKDIK